VFYIFLDQPVASKKIEPSLCAFSLINNSAPSRSRT